MLRYRFTSLIAAGMLLVMTGAASAHHSFAMFDQTQTVILEGTVSDFQWTNPHAVIFLDIRTAQGDMETWLFSMNSPNNLRRQGWRKDTLKTGDKVTIVMHPLRDGGKGGMFVSVTLPDGTVLGDPTQTGNGPINVPTVP
ncbi:MAG: hypothetical protein EPO31_10895 [Gammaproteobacteria bacterium]|jgi:hypothetical protein|nr:MAG: hypothetical protein EPO31_10895 [Gammaproteobacteria bacterium]